MARLTASFPLDAELPIEIGDARLSETRFDVITSIAPFDGQRKTVSDALKSEFGIVLPAPGRSNAKAGIRAISTGPDQTLLIGAGFTHQGAAITDQGDGWTCLTLEGVAARDVLSRLTSIDLRESSFKRGHTARVLLAHMTASLTHTAKDRYDILVFRSMSRTALHDLTQAMRFVAAR